MSFFIGILTFILVIDCLLLILLVLVQLPKKDAGIGMAFGSGAADALFGAGSGNVLTKITKYAAVVLLLLAMGLGYLEETAHRNRSSEDFVKKVDQTQRQTINKLATTPAQAPTPAPKPGTDLLSTQPSVTTNATK
jgi:preprotein translocase subunit SecG